ncbi:pyridoxal phosphate-dependent transferase [Cyathus striatus]|nr:pyridoxal phosphate-dependent transferase [Cyathus striatus]
MLWDLISVLLRLYSLVLLFLRRRGERERSWYTSLIGWSDDEKLVKTVRAADGKFERMVERIALLVRRSDSQNSHHVPFNGITNTLRHGAQRSHARAMSTLKAADGSSLYDFGIKYTTHGLGRLTSGVMVKGQGSYVWYDDGKKMLDFTCGIGVTNLGHVHPKVSKAAAEQCMNIVHAQCSIALHEPYARLIERLIPIMPHPSLDSFFFWNSGSEAVEAAIKMARSITGKQNIICMQDLPKDTAAIIIEPVLGEGGYVPAPVEYLRGLREGLGNGFPISGVVSRRELTDKLVPGSMGGTYAGNAVACAAATAVVDAFHEEKILENVQARSKDLVTALKSLQSDPTLSPHILDVRGKGLMIGVEFASPSGPFSTAHDALVSKDTPKNMASRVATKCIEKGMLILTTSVFEVVRFIPALNASKGEVEEGVGIFEESLREVVKEGGIDMNFVLYVPLPVCQVDASESRFARASLGAMHPVAEFCWMLFNSQIWDYNEWTACETPNSHSAVIHRKRQ